MLVRKPDGTSRLVGDFKRANQSLGDEAYPMPNIIQEAEKIIGVEPATVFSKWDFKSGFWQIPMTESSWPMSTLRGTRGLMQSSRLQMGHKAAPGIFNQRVREHPDRKASRRHEDENGTVRRRCRLRDAWRAKDGRGGRGRQGHRHAQGGASVGVPIPSQEVPFRSTEHRILRIGAYKRGPEDNQRHGPRRF